MNTSSGDQDVTAGPLPDWLLEASLRRPAHELVAVTSLLGTLASAVFCFGLYAVTGHDVAGNLFALALPVVTPLLILPPVTIVLLRLIRMIARTENALRARTSELESEVAERRRAQSELEWLAGTDPLTGAANRRRFMEEAEAVFGHARRSGEHFGVVLFDVDHFKAINDTYGHSYGDEVLRRLAETSRSALREGDVLARIGGEEFALLLPRTRPERLPALAERLRGGVAALDVEPRGAGVAGPRCSVSVGVTSYRTDDESFDVTLRRADDAMYEAKRAGRDRVVVAGPRSASAGERLTAAATAAV